MGQPLAATSHPPQLRAARTTCRAGAKLLGFGLWILGLSQALAHPFGPTSPSPSPSHQTQTPLQRQEETLLDLAPALSHMEDALRDLDLLGLRMQADLASKITVIDLKRSQTGAYLPGKKQTYTAPKAHMGRAWLQRLRAISHVRCHLEPSDLGHTPWPAPNLTKLRWPGYCAGLALRPNHTPLAFTWRFTSGWSFAKNGWQLHALEHVSLKQHAGPSDGLLYEPWLAQMLDRPTFLRVRNHPGDALMVAATLQNSSNTSSNASTLASQTQYAASINTLDEHPGLAIADIDNDGDEDILVLGRFGPPLLLIQSPHGKWQEEAHAWGLVHHNHFSSGLFADFDRDGDVDLLVGRTQARSIYYSQHNGRFVDASHTLGVVMPAYVSAISAADVDGDGWLDVHFATYAADAVDSWAEAIFLAQSFSLPLSGKDLQRRYFPLLPTATRAHLKHLLSKQPYKPHTHRPGPKDIMWRNMGQTSKNLKAKNPLQFEAMPAGSSPAAYRNTFQCSFADWDKDADADLYCAHDFAENTFWINDGSGHFQESARKMGVADKRRFAMSVGFGDLNGDTWPDITIANMESHAADRILSALPHIDTHYKAMAGGNSVFLQTPQACPQTKHSKTNQTNTTNMPRFVRPSQDMGASQSGWAFGAMPRDLDGDGWNDIYSPNGFFTPPPQVAIPVDN